MEITLDEVIEYAEEVAEENQRVVDTGIVFDDVSIDTLYCDDTEVIEEHLANYQRCAEEHRQIAEWLKELKQLREQTKWIPVSERLPEKDMYNGGQVWKRKVLITGYMSFDSKKEPFVTTAFAEEVINKRSYDTIVVAWMPLPEPYKAESSETEQGLAYADQDTMMPAT